MSFTILGSRDDDNEHEFDNFEGKFSQKFNIQA